MTIYNFHRNNPSTGRYRDRHRRYPLPLAKSRRSINSEEWKNYARAKNIRATWFAWEHTYRLRQAFNAITS